MFINESIKKQYIWPLLLIIILVSLLFIRSANAGAYVMPVSVTPGAGMGGKILVVQDIIYWSEDSNQPNPCYGVAECWVGPDVLYTDGTPSLSGSCIFANNCIEISGYQYAYEVADAFKSLKGIPYKSSYTIENEDATCVGIFYVKHLPSSGIRDSSLWPGSTCGKLPPVNQYCNISLPSYVDHGFVRSTNLNGQIMSVSGGISCTESGSLNIYARSVTGENYVYLNTNKSLYSRPLINNQDGWNGVNISVSGGNVNNPFTFTSELHTTGGVITPGYYTGSSIVIISFN